MDLKADTCAASVVHRVQTLRESREEGGWIWSQVGHCQNLGSTLQLPQGLGDTLSLCTPSTPVQSDPPVYLSGHLIVFSCI